MTIVKVQIPLTSSHPDRPALIYAKGRQNLKQQILEPATMKAMGMDFKAFFEAEFNNERWTVGKRVKDQPW